MNPCALDLKAFDVRVVSAPPKCEYGLKAGKRFNLSEVVPHHMCLHAFHVFYPYYVTFKNGGWFEWLFPGEGVCVHCPYPDGIVTKIFRMEPGHGSIVKVVNNPTDCVCGYKAGRSFTLDAFTFCPAALDAMYLGIVRAGQFPVKIRCTDPRCKAVFEISKKTAKSSSQGGKSHGK